MRKREIEITLCQLHDRSFVNLLFLFFVPKQTSEMKNSLLDLTQNVWRHFVIIFMVFLNKTKIFLKKKRKIKNEKRFCFFF